MVAELSSTTYVAALPLEFVSVLTTLLGVSLAIYFGKNERAIAAGIGFSAGIMLLESFFELMQEAVDLAGMVRASTAFILGMLIVAAWKGDITENIPRV